MSIEFSNEYASYGIGADGRNLSFVDRQSGVDYCVRDPASACAQISVGGQIYEATSASCSGQRLELQFGAAQVTAVVDVTVRDHYFILEVDSVSGPQIESLVFAHVPLSLAGSMEERFGACALALNLLANVEQLPGPNNLLRAICWARFGFSGAKVALIGSPQGSCARCCARS